MGERRRGGEVRGKIVNEDGAKENLICGLMPLPKLGKLGDALSKDVGGKWELVGAAAKNPCLAQT